MVYFTCANADREEEVGDGGGKHGQGKTSSSYDCPDDRHRAATVLVHKAARDRSWKSRLIYAHKVMHAECLNYCIQNVYNIMHFEKCA